MADGEASQATTATAEIASRRKLEADLSRATALLQAIGESSTDPIFAKDIDGRFFYANPAVLAIIGESAEKVLGHTDLEFHSDPQQAAMVMANDRRIMETGVAAVIEETWDAADFGTRTYRSTKSPLYREDGSLIGVMCISVDITAALATRDASKLNDQRFRLAMETSATVAYTMDLDLRFTWIRSPIAGNSVEVSTGKTLHDIFVKETADRLAGIYADVIRTGLPVRFDLPVQSRFKPDPQHFDYAVEPLRDARDAIAGVIVAATDITARKQAEETLRKSEERLKFALAAARAGFWETRFDSGEIIASGQALALFGYPPGTKLTHEIALAGIYAEDRPRVLAAMENTVQNGAPYDLELRSQHPDGSIHWIHSRAELQNDDGRLRLVGLVQDITQRKEAEQALALAKAEAERANLAKSKFLAAASHDLRQPVQSLTLLLNVIGRQVADNPKAANVVEMARMSMASLNGMLTGILDISRLDAGVIAPDMASVDLGELVERLAGEYTPRAAELGLVLRQAPGALRARADAALLERILRNLIENALRYTVKGGVLIGVRRRGDHARLDVIDTGIGIPADQQTEIFEEFRQLGNPARESSQGLGLGLSIVSRLARLIGARVEVASHIDRGTRFSLLLPLDRSAPAPDRVAPAIDDASGRILVIEDNAHIRMAYVMMLNEWGYETLSVSSGEEALDRAAELNWRIDAIIADQRLGRGLTGNAAAAEIARRAGRSFPTMLVTGDTPQERLAEVSSSGFAFLRKPVDADDLRRTLASLLRG